MPEMREEELFARAIELPTEARAAFLREACGEDAALRRDVEELVAAHDEEDIIADRIREEAAELSSESGKEAARDSSAGSSGADSDRQLLKKGEKIRFGDYVLIDEIARGAMGVI